MRLTRWAHGAVGVTCALFAALSVAQTPGGIPDGSSASTPAQPTASAQLPASAPASDSAEADNSVPIDPLILRSALLLLDSQPANGPNFTLNIVSVHSSVTGWALVWTPSVSYRLNRHFIFGATLPWYWNIKNYVPVTDKDGTTYPLMSTEDVIGDLSISAQADADLGRLNYSFVASGGFPTGESTFGLSANAATYNATHHLALPLGPFTFALEAGEGDSSSLGLDANTKKSYVAVGPMANFKAGAEINLPRGLMLNLDAFEQMPIGNQDVYGTVTKKVKGKNVTTEVLEGTGVAEDNGFEAVFQIPCGEHLALSGTYMRSLRQETDMAAIGLTWVLRTPKHIKLPY